MQPGKKKNRPSNFPSGRWTRIDLSSLSECHVHVSWITQTWPSTDPPPTICFGWATQANQLGCLHGYLPIPHARNKTDAPDTPTPTLIPSTHLPAAFQRLSLFSRPDALTSSIFSSSPNATRLTVSLSLRADICCVMMADVYQCATCRWGLAKCSKRPVNT